MKRHVKEKNEPVFDSIMKEFSDDYSKTVVMNSSEEIINLIGKNEQFTINTKNYGSDK